MKTLEQITNEHLEKLKISLSKLEVDPIAPFNIAPRHTEMEKVIKEFNSMIDNSNYPISDKDKVKSNFRGKALMLVQQKTS